jgi:hypothetical protein
MQQTGSQPACRPELLSLKVCNTVYSLRNIYVHKGLFCILVSYSKASTAIQKAFWVACYFPESVSEILYYYLVLICPFVQHLERLVLGKQEPVVEHLYYLWLLKGSFKVEGPSGLCACIEDHDDKDGIQDQSKQDMKS